MATENKLSDTRLRALCGKKTDKQKMIADGRGLFSARVSPSGIVSFVFFYRMGDRHSSPVWLTLGKYPDMSLKTARQKRDECRALLTEGKDPRYRAESADEEPQKTVTVKDALDYWTEHYAKEKRKAWKDIQMRFKRHIVSRLGKVPLEQCTVQMWIKCFDEIKKTAPVMSGEVFTDVKQALKFCKLRRYAVSDALNDFTVADMGQHPAEARPGID